MHDCDGVLVKENEKVKDIIVNYYKDFFAPRTNESCDRELVGNVLKRRLQELHKVSLCSRVTADEVEKVFMSMKMRKAPGPYGFSSEFFKHGIFVQSPKAIKDFRPIVCCNIVYKCISTILANRLKATLNDVVGAQQTAYVLGRTIFYGILLIQDCLQGYFSSGRGLRQGDPLSPYLFIIIMEYFSELLKHLSSNGEFTYHLGCKDIELVNISFADDLFIMCGATVGSMQAIKKALGMFGDCSGLKPNLTKSSCYFTDVSAETGSILGRILDIPSATLPV
ncbi:hypothetical protein LIER_40417 [Lithospermum erythrorhizon]|uniref:Reverse transcriptase domain-containing protein n=1 Tax=Lithospermum erythrorhizon TaxID=34254 RepID=A0AAV3QU47_LITER